ncbi:hypothetical protein SCP_1401600 [Sparassis crispa]|uniref:DUF155 domain-containing protein n=1 Tax=Sparassis crispa TaxID=139825 RepID=A0A401H2U0_9APHY|nr:hypothetical protein SCP_1401600 [Sparassis crispa]GBE88755.1 hypothetical protein SCP_1401600 [Sparassis crispa]
MSKPTDTRPPVITPKGHRPRPTRSLSTTAPRVPTRRPSVTGLSLTGTLNPVTGAPKAQRTSKTIQKLVLLPSAPQTKPLPIETEEEEELLGYERDRGVREHKSAGERMSKEQREKAGFRRITAYCVAEGFKMKLLASFLKREHNVHPRVFDEAMYVMYHFPLLPAYGPNLNIRSSAPPAQSDGAEDPEAGFSEVEEDWYQGSYFKPSSSPTAAAPAMGGFIPSTSPIVTGADLVGATEIEVVPETSANADLSVDVQPKVQQDVREQRVFRRKRGDGRAGRKSSTAASTEDFAEAIFFEYGVVVFFGFSEEQERGILEDVEAAGALRRKLVEADWEIEQCHYAHNPDIAYPRIYNDFFTFKTYSHLLKLSVAHAFAQSTLLAHYETHAHRILSSQDTTSIPQQLASTGVLRLSRKEALKLTGRLFTLRRDVNLVSNVLDVPELFWSEASLNALYDAVREYMEIGGRVQVLNEKLAVAEDLLGAIHDHLNNNAMDRITWIIIWLIVVACAVELGEILARLVVHATMGDSVPVEVPVCTGAVAALSALSREEALRTLELIAGINTDQS